MLIELALQAQGALNVVGGAARIELPQKPLTLLRRRQGQRLAALRGGQPRDGFDTRCRALGQAAAQRAGAVRQARVIE